MASIDLSHPNERAIDHIGILDRFNNGEIDGFPEKHPDGWIQAVIDRVQAEIGSGTSRLERIDWSNYTAEERAAWEWYKAEVVDTESWKELVREFKDDLPPQDALGWKEFGDSDKLEVDGRIRTPEVKVYSGGDNKDGDLKVSTEAIRYFANSLGALFDNPDGRGGSMMLDVGDHLGNLDVLPGKFAVAELMRQKIHGAGGGVGLVVDTQGLLSKIHQTLYTLRLSLLEMADSYELTEDGNARTGKDFEEKTEEFNSMSEEDFAKAMSDPWGHIGDIDDYGDLKSSGRGGKDESGAGDGSASGGSDS
ncbi:hypothetical protein [Micromonospora sp. NPDC048898]|uniref:hypothetical protein n=1 Tax=Micromonospora sp. NPDC048898 TaxID=3364260 RepID=UPI00371946AC